MHEGDIPTGQGLSLIVSSDLNALLLGLRKRHSSNPIDKMCAIAFPFMKCNYAASLRITLPIYDSNTPTSVAWERVISSLASTTMTLDEATLVAYPGDDDILHSFAYKKVSPLVTYIRMHLCIRNIRIPWSCCLHLS